MIRTWVLAVCCFASCLQPPQEPCEDDRECGDGVCIGQRCRASAEATGNDSLRRWCSNDESVCRRGDPDCGSACVAEVRCTLRWEDGTVAGGVTLLCSDTGEVVADSEGLISLRVSEYIGGFAGYQNSCGRATFALDGVELAAEQRQPRDSNRDGVLSAEERFQVSRLPDGGVTPAAAPPGDWVSGGDNCEYRLAPWPASGE